MNRLAAIMPLREGKPWMTNVALSLLGCGLVMLARQFVAEHVGFAIGFSGVAAWSVLLYAGAVAIVLTQPVNRWTMWIVIGFAVACRVIPLAAEPFTSSDIYRYVWDGVVQHAGFNPYRYVPGDPALGFLRTPYQELFDNMNRRDTARTIYPPVAQMIYWVVTFFAPTVGGMKVAMAGFECVTVVGLVQLLRRMGRCTTDVLVYAWCPLLVWEVGGAGHIDAAVIAFVVLAMLFRYDEKPVWTGVFLACAVLTKFYPLVLFPALWMRKDWKMPAVMVGMAVAAYGIYSSVGKLVLGFAGGYAKEEGIDDGTRYFLLEWVRSLPGMKGFPVWGYVVFCVGVFGGISWWAWKWATVERPKDNSRSPTGMTTKKYIVAAMGLGVALMLLFSPHYPWYVIWLVPFLVLAPGWALMGYLMAFFYLFTTALADGTAEKMFLLNKILYGATVVACVVGWAWRRWSLREWFVSTEHKPYESMARRVYE